MGKRKPEEGKDAMISLAIDIVEKLDELIGTLEENSTMSEAAIPTGVLIVDGKPYQVQLMLCPNKSNWIPEGEVHYYDSMKVDVSKADQQ